MGCGSPIHFCAPWAAAKPIAQSEPAHIRIAKSSVRSECDRNRGRYCIQPREGTMPASHEILICAALTTALLLQGSSCFGDDDHSNLSSTWKLVAFMTEDIDNKLQENVCDTQAEGYLTFTAAGRRFGFATTKRGGTPGRNPESYAKSPPVMSFSGHYRAVAERPRAQGDLSWQG